MATLSFEGETHQELVTKVKRWLASLQGEEELLSPTEVVAASAELTKDALRILANAAPKPVAQSDLVKGLTSMGYSVTDSTAKAVTDLMGTVAQVSDGGVKAVKDTQQNLLWEMNTALAKSVLRGLGITKK
jgi:hypothetical protein